MRFDELAEDFLNDYRINGKRSLPRAELSVFHLKACFGGLKAMQITTADIRTYIDRRQKAGATNASINRELAALKLMFNLAVQAERSSAGRISPT